tara:strand:+ start:10209 stop:11018 length:810 start_codon:yes stop_codon:yes gene_type:complete
MLYNIGIIGRGFVGSALNKYLSQKFNTLTYDIADSIDMVEGYDNVVNNSDIIYVCVPTPSSEDGSCDISYLEKTLSLINEVANAKCLVLIKSTVVPNTTQRLRKKYEKCNIVFNPEFLTERTAYEDVANATSHVIGVEDDKTAEYLVEYHRAAWPDPNCKYFVTETSIAEMVKYATNTFFGIKVSFANVLYDICKSLNIDYNKMSQHMQDIDPRVGTVHWQVPGPDGLRGFGGKCLPKELSGMIDICNKHNVNCDLLSTTKEYNKQIRG